MQNLDLHLLKKKKKKKHIVYGIVSMPVTSIIRDGHFQNLSNIIGKKSVHSFYFNTN